MKQDSKKDLKQDEKANLKQDKKANLQQEEKFVYMTTTPVPRLIGELAVPTIISMLVTSFYNMADTFFVGKINTQSTAAVGIVFSVMAIIQALGFFFGHGSGNYISRRLGAQDFEEASTMAANGFFLSFFCGIVVMAGGLVFFKAACRHAWLYANNSSLYGGLSGNYSDRGALYDFISCA